MICVNVRWCFQKSSKDPVKYWYLLWPSIKKPLVTGSTGFLNLGGGCREISGRSPGNHRVARYGWNHRNTTWTSIQSLRVPEGVRSCKLVRSKPTGHARSPKIPTHVYVWHLLIYFKKNGKTSIQKSHDGSIFLKKKFTDLKSKAWVSPQKNYGTYLGLLHMVSTWFLRVCRQCASRSTIFTMFFVKFKKFSFKKSNFLE